MWDSHTGRVPSSPVANHGKDISVTHGDPPKRKRAPYTAAVFREVKLRLAAGEMQHDIAADLGWNQGRISEVNTGKRGTNPAQPALF